MVNTLINARQKQKSDTTYNWENKNPILFRSEIGFEFCIDGSVKMKIGDGNTPWKSLPYIIEPVSVQKDDIFLQVDIEDLQTTIDALPKIINANVQIQANAGTWEGTIEIKGFTGTGTLMILGDLNSENPTTFVDFIALSDNSLASIEVSMFQVVNYISVYYCYLGTVKLYKIWSTEAVFNGVKISSSAMVILEECVMQNKTYPYIVNGPGLTFINNCTYDNYEQYAYYVARGSVTLIYPAIPSGVDYAEVEGGKILMITDGGFEISPNTPVTDIADGKLLGVIDGKVAGKSILDLKAAQTVDSVPVTENTSDVELTVEMTTNELLALEDPVSSGVYPSLAGKMVLVTDSAASDETFLRRGDIGVPDGVAGLDGDMKLFLENMPDGIGGGSTDAAEIFDSNAYTVLNTPANSSQQTINTAIDLTIGNVAVMQDGLDLPIGFRHYMNFDVNQDRVSTPNGMVFLQENGQAVNEEEFPELFYLIGGSSGSIVPPMTANNVPAPFIASASAYGSAQPPYMAFDRTTSNFWNAELFAPQWIQIYFGDRALLISEYEVLTRVTGIHSWQLQGSLDGAQFDTIHSIQSLNTIAGQPYKYAIKPDKAYRYIRLYLTQTPQWVAIQQINLSGGKLLTNTPKDSTGRAMWIVASAAPPGDSGGSTTDAAGIFDSNAYAFLNTPANSSQQTINTAINLIIGKLLGVIDVVPKMTSSNTPAPFIVTTNSEDPGNPAWRAFDKNITPPTAWAWSGNTQGECWACIYLGSNPPLLLRYEIWPAGGNSAHVLEGSFDGAQYTQINTVGSFSFTEGQSFSYNISPAYAYNYIRIRLTGSGWKALGELKLYAASGL